MSLQFWQQGSRPSHREASHLVLVILAMVTSAWTRPLPPWQVPTPQAPLLRLRVVGEHLTALDPGLLSHRTQATLAAVAGILDTALARWAAATLPRTCYLRHRHPLQSHLLLEGTKCLATLTMHRNLQFTTEAALCTPQPHHTVPTSPHATHPTPMLEDLGHTCTTPQCLHLLLPISLISPHCQTGIGTVTETQGRDMAQGAQGALLLEGHLTITSRTQTLPQSTIPITPTIIQNAGRTGGTGETAWAPGLVTTATRDTATTTILTTTMAAAAADEAAMIGTGTETEIGTETETETVITQTALIPDTIQTPTALPQTACLLPPLLTLHTPPPKSPPLPLLRDWTLPPVWGARASQRGALCLR